VTVLTTPLAAAGFSQAQEAVTIPAGVAKVRLGGLRADGRRDVRQQ
jgi:hypothetical protein